ncbi:MAG: DNA-directed RNA polymerase subunit omega [Bacteroidales bacterium]|nr:DNA-directed RNA polymerase subunit omega [Candidatus Colimorpha onthohippi]
MEDKKKKVTTTITRNTANFSQQTGNIYETVAMLSKRANQIASNEKRELQKKLEEFGSGRDTMDDYYENREQVEIVRHFEQMPKPTLTATEEYLNNKLSYRNPNKEDQRARHMQELENKATAEKEDK